MCGWRLCLTAVERESAGWPRTSATCWLCLIRKNVASLIRRSVITLNVVQRVTALNAAKSRNTNTWASLTNPWWEGLITSRSSETKPARSVFDLYQTRHFKQSPRLHLFAPVFIFWSIPKGIQIGQNVSVCKGWFCFVFFVFVFLSWRSKIWTITNKLCREISISEGKIKTAPFRISLNFTAL